MATLAHTPPAHPDTAHTGGGRAYSAPQSCSMRSTSVGASLDQCARKVTKAVDFNLTVGTQWRFGRKMGRAGEGEGGVEPPEPGSKGKKAIQSTNSGFRGSLLPTRNQTIKSPIQTAHPTTQTSPNSGNVKSKPQTSKPKKMASC